MIRFLTIFSLIFTLVIPGFSQAKKDTIIVRNDSIIAKNGVDQSHLPAKDSVVKKKHSPHTAAIRSAILPGWGQAYNRKYWKIPIVYGALGTTAAIFVYNLKTYKSLKQAYINLLDTIPANDALIEERFQQLSPESIRSYRTSFRQNVDYSVLFFLVFWGLNVVDATVDAHLKSFDVSNDISMKLKPTIGNATPGLSIVFILNDKSARKKLFLP